MREADYREGVTSRTGLPLVLDLDGPRGNAFVILGDALRTMRDSGLGNMERGAFLAEATDSDYENLLRVVGEWFDVYRPGDPVATSVDELLAERGRGEEARRASPAATCSTARGSAARSSTPASACLTAGG
jgi:hypothetical protein